MANDNKPVPAVPNGPEPKDELSVLLDLLMLASNRGEADVAIEYRAAIRKLFRHAS